jgi:hypothetical protein
MKTLAQVAGELTGAPRPVLCLDTCVLLDVITTGNRGQVDLIEVHRRLLEVITTTPARVQPLVTSLVLREWLQRRDEVRDEASRWLAGLDKQIRDVHDAWDRLGVSLAHHAPNYDDLGLIDALTGLAESLIRSSILLREDRECVLRALHRVKWKRRPSHKHEIKDSIHLEHYLEISRRLRTSGYGELVVFVSTNSSDFWEDKNRPTPHPDLIGELEDAGLEFFGRLPLALRRLGILGAPTTSAGGPTPLTTP